MPANTPANIFAKPKALSKPNFKTPAPRRVRKDIGAVAQEIPVEEILPTIIQGIAVGSKEEARLAVALDKMGMRYRFHVQIFGGHQLRGGLELDFLVTTPPLPTPILVQGSYWHTGIHADPFDTARINAIYAGKKYNRVVEIWDRELTSISAAITAVRNKLPQG